MVKVAKIVNLLMAIIFNFQVQSLIFFPRIVKAQEAPNISLKRNKIEVNNLIISGNTVFSDAELKTFLGKYQGKAITIAELNTLTNSLTDLYVSNGYLSSGAFVPSQDVSDGLIKIQIVEGKLERLEVRGLKYLEPSYVTSLLDFEPRQLLNINSLTDKLSILEQSSAIEGVKAELVKGSSPGQSVLLLEIEEHPPFKAGLEFNNYRSPSIGEFQGSINSSYQNLIGVGERAFGEYNLTEGFDAYSIGYSLPVAKNNGTISLEYRHGESKIIENNVFVWLNS